MRFFKTLIRSSFYSLQKSHQECNSFSYCSIVPGGKALSLLLENLLKIHQTTNFLSSLVIVCVKFCFSSWKMMQTFFLHSLTLSSHSDDDSPSRDRRFFINFSFIFFNCLKSLSSSSLALFRFLIFLSSLELLELLDIELILNYFSISHVVLWTAPKNLMRNQVTGCQ